MSRSRAFLYHLAGTVAVLVLLSLAVRLAWFPEPYGRGLGLVRLLGMLWLLQIATGPLLTLLLYRPGKRGLKFDMALVALLQAGTLAIALWMIVQARPVFVVFAVDRFEVVRPGDVTLADATIPAFATLPLSGPVLAVAELPSDPMEASDLVLSALDGAGDVHNFARYYRPYVAPHTDAVLERARPLGPLLKRNAEARRVIEARLGDEAGLGRRVYVPVMFPEAVMTAVLDPADGTVLAVVPVAPGRD